MPCPEELEGLMGTAVPWQRLWQGLRDAWGAEPEESLAFPPLLRQGQLDPSPAFTDAL